MNCESCTHRPDPVPFAVHESAMARNERSQRRLWIVVLVLIVLLFGTNAAWIYYESQMETVEVTQENEDGYNNFIGNDGDIYNGETDSKIPSP